MKNEIKEHYKFNFSSSPINIKEKEIGLLIENDCKCNYCGESIFKMIDFPEILIEESEIICEDCYSEHYREICPICENSYDVKDFMSDHIVINEELAVETNKQPGIYKILERPFFFGCIVFGFDSFLDNTIELVVSIRINDFKKIDCGNGCCEVSSDNICPDCVDTIARKSNYLRLDGTPYIFNKKCENDDLFSDYTPERLHRTRQRLIHQRITMRGMIEQGNHNNR